MIIPDVSILVHSYNSDSPKHAAARDWWEETFSRPRPVGLPWVVILGFIRVMTHRGIMRNPLHVKDAVRHVRQWLENGRAEILAPGEDHSNILFQLFEDIGTAGNLTTDAHLAALAIEYQGEIASTDTDFSRFKGLRWFDPTGEG